MTLIAIIITSTLAALLLVQIYLTAGFIRRAGRLKLEPLSDEECSKVALVICVRGNDPTLEGCLRSALSQNYPNYGVHIIVDSESDPAWPVVNEIVQSSAHKNVTVQVLAQPLESCSLKCSSLIQVVSSLDLSYEIIALLDIDVVPDPRWLRGLVTPLSDPSIGATTGNRWFLPQPPSMSNLARHAWNAAAVVMMYWLKIAWGGSLVIRRSVFEEGGLLERWSRSYGEDTSLSSSLHEVGLRLEFVPAAMLEGQGDTTRKETNDWVTRQLLSCRLHHAGWWSVAAHGAIMTIALLAGIALFTIGLAAQHWSVVIPIAAALVAYMETMVLLLTWINSSLLEFVGTVEGAPKHRKTRVSPGKLLGAVICAQLMHARALMRAAFARSVEWRGIPYRVDDTTRIRMKEYRPIGNVRHYPST